MDELAKKLNIIDKEEWYKITIKTIQQNGGSGLLSKYNGSPRKLLTTVYPEYL